MARRKGYSPYSAQAIRFVGEHPGCSKFDLARALTRSPLRCPSRQYYLVNTQVSLGNIVAHRVHSSRYELYLPEDYVPVIQHDALYAPLHRNR